MINYYDETVINSYNLSNLIFIEKKQKNWRIIDKKYIYDCYYMLQYFDENDDYYILEMIFS